jgi:hypothetical protein
MQRVTGLGGVFVKTADKDRLRHWCRDPLGIAVMDHGANFESRFDSWRSAGRQAPFVGFEPREFIARELAPGYALATFARASKGATGRRSLVTRRGPDGWRLVHMHAPNLG